MPIPIKNEQSEISLVKKLLEEERLAELLSQQVLREQLLKKVDSVNNASSLYLFIVEHIQEPF